MYSSCTPPGSGGQLEQYLRHVVGVHWPEEIERPLEGRGADRQAVPVQDAAWTERIWTVWRAERWAKSVRKANTSADGAPKS